MNRDCPKIVSDEYLQRRVFCYATSIADNRYFRQRIVDYLKDNLGTSSFTEFMFHAIWERNDEGRTLKYCYFDEHNQKVKIDNYFYEWMTRTIRKIENELKLVSEQEQQRSQQSPITPPTAK